MVVNAAQLASYSQAKQAILGSGYIQVSQGMCDENWTKYVRQTQKICFVYITFKCTQRDVVIPGIYNCLLIIILDNF